MIPDIKKPFLILLFLTSNSLLAEEELTTHTNQESSYIIDVDLEPVILTKEDLLTLIKFTKGACVGSEELNFGFSTDVAGVTISYHNINEFLDNAELPNAINSLSIGLHCWDKNNKFNDRPGGVSMYKFGVKNKGTHPFSLLN
ncbi:MAG: hypothetical protein ACRENZ_11195 [Thermodesulfobacteriota bacterium]